MREMCLIDRRRLEKLEEIESKYYVLKRSLKKSDSSKAEHFEGRGVTINQDEPGPSDTKAENFVGRGLLPLPQEKQKPKSSLPKIPKLIDKPIVPHVTSTVFVSTQLGPEQGLLQTMPQRYFKKSKTFLKELHARSKIRIDSNGDVFVNEEKVPGDGFALIKAYLTNSKKYVLGKDLFFQEVIASGLGHFLGKRPEPIEDFRDADEWWYIGD